jgi:hypothetical protein
VWLLPAARREPVGAAGGSVVEVVVVVDVVVVEVVVELVVDEVVVELVVDDVVEDVVDEVVVDDVGVVVVVDPPGAVGVQATPTSTVTVAIAVASASRAEFRPVVCTAPPVGRRRPRRHGQPTDARGSCRGRREPLPSA